MDLRASRDDEIDDQASPLGGVEGLSLPVSVGVPFDVRVGDCSPSREGAGEALPGGVEAFVPGIGEYSFGLFASCRVRG